MNLLPHHLCIKGVQGGVGYSTASNDQSGRSNNDLTLWDQDAPSRGAVPYPHHAIAGIFWNRGVNEVSRHAERRKNFQVSHDRNSHSLCNGNDDDMYVTRRAYYLVARLGKSFRTALATLSESVRERTQLLLSVCVAALLSIVTSLVSAANMRSFA